MELRLGQHSIDRNVIAMYVISVGDTAIVGSGGREWGSRGLPTLQVVFRVSSLARLH